MTDAGPLPMFPLGSVLFPGGLLPLHVFEPRYRALTQHCLSEDRELGIVLIERGHEVGGGDVRFGVGTRAHIIDAAELDDGRWVLVLHGRQRIRVSEWLPDDPYPQAIVTPLDDGPPGPDAPDLRDAVERQVRKALALKAELGEAAPPATVPIDPDPAVAVYQAAAVAPLGPADRQRLLETDGVEARLTRLLELLAEEVDVLARRVCGQ